MTTLREQAAIAAMQGLLADVAEFRAVNARECADALVAELERTKPKAEVTPTCATCRYWVDGECRRYAPRPHTPRAQLTRLKVEAPETTSYFWCGEWEGT